MIRRPGWWWAAAMALLTACQTPVGEVRGLADLPPLDYAVMVTGGAFLQEGATEGTFAGTALAEPVPIADVLGVLREGAVFRRVEVDGDAAQRRRLVTLLRRGPADDAAVRDYLQQVRQAGYDWLLVVEQLQDGPVEAQGVNGRWPVTLSFWLLFGLGALIPDHTFESRATLRITLRDLQTGRVVHDPLLSAGPVDLSLVERSNLLGFVVSLVVPPFWVHDDADHVADSVRDVTRRRLLVSLARALKSEETRQRLRERSVAALDLVWRGGRPWLRIDSGESLSTVRLRQGERAFDGPAVADLERALLASAQREGEPGRERYRYEAPLAVGLVAGPVQVLVATIAGNVASATLDYRTEP